MSSLSTGLRLGATWDRLEQRERVELDLDMVETEPGVGGTLSASSWRELETVLFLASRGVEPGVLMSDKSELD